MPNEVSPDAQSATPAGATTPSETTLTTESAGTATDVRPGVSGHVSDEDFSHPVYGAKLRNLYDGLQDKSQKLSKFEKEHGELKTKWDRVAQFLNRPDVSQAIRAHLQESQGGSGATQTTDETEEDQRLQEWRDEIESGNRADLAMMAEFIRLGQGDIAKGQALFSERHEPLMAVLEEMDSADARGRLALATELFESRQARRQPTPVPEKPPERGTVATEMSRGSSSGVPAPEGKMESFMDALRAAGFSSPSEYLRATGTL